jgi:hypothetical protein
VVENLTEISRRWPFDAGLCRYLRVVRQDAGVIKQFLSIDVGLEHVAKARNEELQDAPMVGRD